MIGIGIGIGTVRADTNTTLTLTPIQSACILGHVIMAGGGFIGLDPLQTNATKLRYDLEQCMYYNHGPGVTIRQDFCVGSAASDTVVDIQINGTKMNATNHAADVDKCFR